MEFSASVVIDGVGLIGFGVETGVVSESVEDVVGGVVDEFDVFIMSDDSEVEWSGGVDLVCFFVVEFSSVYVRISSTINNDVGGVFFDYLVHHHVVTDVIIGEIIP